MRALRERQHWVFDMDGTLTLAVHDFAEIRRALAIPAEADILAHLASLPEPEAARCHAWLLEHERALAEAAQPAPGAVALVRDLHARGVRLGILTRTARPLAQITRRSIGLRIDAEGLSVRAPTRTPLAEVDAALQQKADWILRKLAEARERQQRESARAREEEAGW